MATQNDPLLDPLLRAEDPAARDQEIERLIVTVIQPLTGRILSRYVRAEGAVGPMDAEDIVAVVNLRLVRKLRSVGRPEEEAIQRLTEYVATLAYNTINDHFRRRYPERARLKNRLRYVLRHDPRLGTWHAGGDLVAGLSATSHAAEFASASSPPRRVTRLMLDSTRPADALVEIFRELEQPMLFRALVDHVAALWNVEDEQTVPLEEADEHDAQPGQQSTRDFLAALWREIGLLPAPQRKALLLNLRDAEAVNVVSLLAITGTAELDEIAAALEMSADELAAIWNDLPLDDLRIGGLLNLPRQQVINLRKSARERLGRRMLRKR